MKSDRVTKTLLGVIAFVTVVAAVGLKVGENPNRLERVKALAISCFSE